MHSERNATRVLLTGMSGTGKSSVIAELRRRSYSAIDMDEPGWSEHNEEGHQLWLEDRLESAINDHTSGPLFVCGCAENQVKFYPRFQHIVLLSAPPEVIKQRLANRTTNTYGKQADELAYVLDHLNWLEPRLRKDATHEISTVAPLHQVVEELIALVNAQ